MRRTMNELKLSSSEKDAEIIKLTMHLQDQRHLSRENSKQMLSSQHENNKPTLQSIHNIRGKDLLNVQFGDQSGFSTAVAKKKNDLVLKQEYAWSQYPYFKHRPSSLQENESLDTPSLVTLKDSDVKDNETGNETEEILE